MKFTHAIVWVTILLSSFCWTERFCAAGESTNFRNPVNEEDLRYWLQNMVWYHRFSIDEIKSATGLNASDIESALKKFDITSLNKPKRKNNDPLLVVPYPGGRHPRIGFLDGAIRP